MGRRQQSIVNSRSENTSVILALDRFQESSWTDFSSILGGFWVSKSVMLGSERELEAGEKDVVRCYF